MTLGNIPFNISGSHTVGQNNNPKENTIKRIVISKYEAQ